MDIIAKPAIKKISKMEPDLEPENGIDMDKETKPKIKIMLLGDCKLCNPFLCALFTNKLAVILMIISEKADQ